MTIEPVPGTPFDYYLVSYDKHGREYNDPEGMNGLMSLRIERDIADHGITDVFLLSHGWKGDVPAAKSQYEAWIKAMADCGEDVEKVRAQRPGFKPLIIGFHWPSLPWGDESYGGISFAAGGADAGPPVSEPEDPVRAQIDAAAESIADSAAARQALETIFAAALDDIAPDNLPPAVVSAYETLAAEAGLETGGDLGAAPGDDVAAFDPEASYQTMLELEEDIYYGDSSIGGGILGGLRQLSFWKMKKRARSIGESSAATLIRRLQEIGTDGPGGDNVRFHLMGHSFGCIVVSAAIAGRDGDEPLVRPIDSVLLAQGALSLWAYCSDIPVAPGKPGYFSSIVAGGKVAGPLVTTQSMHDTAVGVLYPLAAGAAFLAADAVAFDFDPTRPPKYGALGTYGIQGPGVDLDRRTMGPVDTDYEFVGGRAYNVEGSGVINEGGGASGAHNDIAKPEVGHAFWSAILAAP